MSDYLLDEAYLKNFTDKVPELESLEAAANILRPDFETEENIIIHEEPYWFSSRTELTAVDSNKHGDSEEVRAYARVSYSSNMEAYLDD